MLALDYPVTLGLSMDIGNSSFAVLELHALLRLVEDLAIDPVINGEYHHPPLAMQHLPLVDPPSRFA